MNRNDRASFAGCLVRLTGHDFMDFRYNRSGDATYNEKGVRGELTGGSTGGADGCMSFEDGDNKGLAKCVQKFEIDKVY